MIATLTPFPAPTAPAVSAASLAGLLRRTWKDVGTASALLCAAAEVAYADAVLQDWIPGVLEFPADAEVVLAKAAGRD